MLKYGAFQNRETRQHCQSDRCYQDVSGRVNIADKFHSSGAQVHHTCAINSDFNQNVFTNFYLFIHLNSTHRGVTDLLSLTWPFCKQPVPSFIKPPEVKCWRPPGRRAWLRWCVPAVPVGGPRLWRGRRAPRSPRCLCCWHISAVY